VLGVLTVAGGWLNLPEVITDLLPLGPTDTLGHWLEPVVGASTARLSAGEVHASVTLEEILVGVAVLVGVAGILFAWARLKPARLVPKRESVPEAGFERIVAEKYFVDEAVDRGVVMPTYALSRSVLWKFVDNGIIDGLFVNGSAAVARGFGWMGSRLQSGNTGIYAWVLVVGVVAVLGAFTLR
jgi:NADH-quinone oxidoreductase subunit L